VVGDGLALMIYREPQRAEPYAPTPPDQASIVLGVHGGVHGLEASCVKKGDLRGRGESRRSQSIRSSKEAP
jgi:hypothetical protein